MAIVNNPYERQHIANLAKYGRWIDAIFKQAAVEAASISHVISNFDDSRVFSFNDYPITQGMVQSLLSRLGNSVETAIVNGINAEWTLANNKNNELSRLVFGENVGRLTQEQYRRYFSTNGQALDAFLQRKEQGLNLSERVWRYANDFKNDIELGLDVGIRNGLDAPAISRELQQFLQHPDMLFRRVRDEHGDLVLSQRAADYHPGQGVYRSSYKNARRLAVTETNMAYRSADYERWQQLDFVVGIEIKLSNNHTVHDSKGNLIPLYDICDELKGRYPKDFKFTGWHPHCRCHVETILKTEEELMEENRAILAGEEPSYASANRVDEVPDNFKQWVVNNQLRLSNARSVPYFMAQNSDRVAKLLADNPVEKTTQQAREVLMGSTIGDLKNEFRITGEEYYSNSPAMQFDFLGVKEECVNAVKEYGIDLDSCYIYIQDDGSFSFTIRSSQMEYSDAQKRQMHSFEMRRYFYVGGANDGGLLVEHNTLDMIDRITGKDITKQLFRKSYLSYQRMGASEICVCANITVGGYAWAKYGFFAENMEQALVACEKGGTFRQTAENFIVDWYKKNGTSEDAPFPMYLLAQQPYGKQLLLGGHWYGRLSMRNNKQVEIFEKYIGLR